MMRTMRALVSVILLCAIAGVCLAQPQPAIVPKPGDWTLDVRFENPMQIVLPGTVQQRFWYVILTLTNKSGKDVDFYPTCELMTDTFQRVPAIQGTSAILFEKIKNRHQGRYPFLELLENAGNKILQGQDNAKDVVVFWPDFDPNAKSFDIFISGFSNEIAVVDHPVEKDPDGNPVKIYLRKTLQLTYSLAGDPKFRDKQKLKLENKQWVMR
ncbi:MAG: hypothetical protein ABII09_06990 [Planctomycetota bacterium]